jgi:hypothetical protein
MWAPGFNVNLILIIVYVVEIVDLCDLALSLVCI